MNGPFESYAEAKRRPTIPSLPVVTITPASGRRVQLAGWCPWCEAVHRHGAEGGGGNRAPHCAEDRNSPFGQTGYDLDIIGDAPSEEAVIPSGLMVGHRQLHRVLDQSAELFRAVLLRLVLDVKTVRGSVLQKRMRQGSVWVFPGNRWVVEPHGRQATEGLGFSRLAALLYGVPPGIAAVRFLEAASGDRLDATAAFEIQRAVDAWVARGAESRPAR
jgi:hypothetical protein